MTAYMHGTSTRKVGDLVRALGCDSGVSKSTLSRICGEIDEQVAEFRDRALAHTVADDQLDPGQPAGAQPRRNSVQNTSSSESPTSTPNTSRWPLAATPVAAHQGLKAAVTGVLVGASWQRCRVHFVRNALAKVTKGHPEMVAATIRTIFVQPDAAAARAQLHVVADMLADRFPAVVDQLVEAEGDLLAYTAFPHSHWRRIWSTNPLERVNKEIKRRSNVVGVSPNDVAVIRLVGAVLLETHDEW